MSFVIVAFEPLLTRLAGLTQYAFCASTTPAQETTLKNGLPFCRTSALKSSPQKWKEFKARRVSAPTLDDTDRSSLSRRGQPPPLPWTKATFHVPVRPALSLSSGGVDVSVWQ